ncbi:hypothetical protein niasHT_022177 [Heterodera trifolii]|uniref:BTB domain-containing protein n=1 Tax=Heterodera trifolii TaxID=157864 RepID=A0ABD2KPA2_9BILA
MPKSPTDWMKLLLSTGEYADVHFLVGDGDEKKLVPAHKLILKHASDVFEAMFRFDSKNANSENESANCPVVEVPDVEAAAFKVLLSFIYAGDLSGLNGDNAMAVLYAAKKYNIPDLVDPSLQIPVSKLRNVFLAFAQARLFDLEDFANCCLSYIDKNADTLIKTDEFLQIDQKMLSEILERDELQTRGEFSIWNANRRAVLGPALFKIRFPLLTKKEFLKIIPSKVLTAEEKFGVYQFFCQPHFNPVKFPSHWRNWTFGRISMDIEKVSEFAREPMESYRYSDNTVYIKGLSWKILAQINQRTEGTENEKYLGIFLLCDALKQEDKNFSCKCSATLRIVSKMNGVENSVGKFYDLVFNNNLYGIGDHFIAFSELMEPSNGFYDQNRDKRTESNDNNEKWLSIYLLCAAPQEDINWSCKCSAIVRIVSQKCGVADIKEEFNEETTFNSESVAKGYSDFISFAELMDPLNGVYDKGEDKVTLAIDVTVKEAKTGVK